MPYRRFSGKPHRPPTLSVIVPLYNEEANVVRTAERVVETIDPVFRHWELILVDDGSSDRTPQLVEEVALRYPMVQVVHNAWNRGVGGALKAGFAAARGELLATLDGDLSYAPEYVVRVVKLLQESPHVDIAIGSPYMRGGGTKGVPFHRLVLSRAANKLLCWSLSRELSTVTGILCGYRRTALEQIELRSEGKEIHFELVSKALALGLVVREVPAILEGRRLGLSKTRIRQAIVSHLIFSFYEKPSLLFGMIGLAMLAVGLAAGGYLAYLFLGGRLDPERPLVVVTVVLLLGGLQLFSFGFVATQLTLLRNELYRMERAIRKPSPLAEKATDVRDRRHLA